MSSHPDSKVNLAARRLFLQRSALMLGGAAIGLPAIAVAKECRLTEREILGPMYNFGAPFQTKLIGDDEPGERLMLSGRVYSSDCQTPLPGTLIEIWQADHNGQYDKKKPFDFFEPSPPFRLRGVLQTDANGRYEIETIVPGSYPVPPGLPGLEKYAGLTRARHIHVNVLPGLHVPLTTQLYFKDDPNRAGDPWAGHKPSLVLDPKQDGRYLRAEFDFVVANGLQGESTELGAFSVSLAVKDIQAPERLEEPVVIERIRERLARNTESVDPAHPRRAPPVRDLLI